MFSCLVKTKTELGNPWKFEIKLLAEVLSVKGLVGLKPDGLIGMASHIVPVDHHNSRVRMLLRSPFL